MSWSFYIPVTSVAEFESAANDAKATYVTSLEGNDVVLDQVASGAADEAIKAAVAIVASGVVGGGTVQASLSGHANPDHKPTQGWANDQVSITVSCADKYEAPAAASA